MRICLVLIAVALTLAAQVPFSPYSDRPPGLDAPIERFVIHDEPFDVVLRNLAALARPNAVIGFEPAIGGELRRLGSERELKNETVGGVLSLMTAADDRYRYSEPRPGVIRVQPKVEHPELAAILDLPIGAARIDIHDWPSNVIARIAGFLPELGRYLRSRELEWSRKTGRPLPGSPGIIMSGNVPPPLLSVALRDTTVRGVLDAIAAYTLEHGSKMLIEDPWVPPTGWRIDFKPDPEAFTGLGGYVSWSRFP